MFFLRGGDPGGVVLGSVVDDMKVPVGLVAVEGNVDGVCGGEGVEERMGRCCLA